MEYFIKAAEQQHPGALCEYGSYYEKGLKGANGQYIIEKDLQEAQKYYQEAADKHDNAEAQNKLGVLYYKNKISRKSSYQ